MTLDFNKLIENSIRKEMTVSHFEGMVKVQTVDELPQKAVDKINKQYGEKYLGDADYVVMFKGPFDRDDSGKLYKLTNRALGVDANRMTEEDFKFIKLDKETQWVPAQDDSDEEAEAPETQAPGEETYEPGDDEEAEAPETQAPDEEAFEPDIDDAGEEGDDEQDFEPDADEPEDDVDSAEDVDFEPEGEEGDDEQDFEPGDDEEAEAPEEDMDESEKYLPPENPDEWKAEKLELGQDDWEEQNDPTSHIPYKPGKSVSEEEYDAAPAEQAAPQKPLAFAFLKITSK